MNDFILFAAPLQGLTDAAFRHFHAIIAGCADSYFSPFVRMEKGMPRHRDMRDISSPLNHNHSLIPQIIFRDFNEFHILATSILNAGFRHIDLNLGCPFPPQVMKGRGAAAIRDHHTIGQIADWLSGNPDIGLSVKMRLGVDSPDEWQQIMPLLDSMPLTHITVHPRTAAQQYSGHLQMDVFSEILSATGHRVIFNGDILSPADIHRLRDTFPSLGGIMAGRGLLSRPTLFCEWRQGIEMPPEQRATAFLDIHRLLIRRYSEILCGDSQILSKLKPWWDYAPAILPRKDIKRIRKATTLTRYHEILDSMLIS